MLLFSLNPLFPIKSIVVGFCKPRIESDRFGENCDPLEIVFSVIVAKLLVEIENSILIVGVF
jgi:hypothetical protein